MLLFPSTGADDLRAVLGLLSVSPSTPSRDTDDDLRAVLGLLSVSIRTSPRDLAPLQPVVVVRVVVVTIRGVQLLRAAHAVQGRVVVTLLPREPNRPKRETTISLFKKKSSKFKQKLDPKVQEP